MFFMAWGGGELAKAASRSFVVADQVRGLGFMVFMVRKGAGSRRHAQRPGRGRL